MTQYPTIVDDEDQPPSEDRLMQAKIDLLSSLATKAKLETQNLHQTQVEYLASARQARIFPFYGAVNKGNVGSCIEILGEWTREDLLKPIKVVFNSPGGSVTDGLALFDYIKYLQGTGQRIDTHAIGWAASMSGILLQAGDERSMGPNSYMMIHEISAETEGTLTEIRDASEVWKRMQYRCQEILSSRSHWDQEAIEAAWDRRDTWLDADEALEAGFVDKIE